MKSFLLVALFLGAASAFEMSFFDPEACVRLTDTPITRLVDANIPQLVATPGFNYSDPDGTIYPADTLCQWSFFVDPGTTLDLNFFNFTLEDTAGCTDDYVQIYDGADDTGTLMGTICGSVAPEPGYTATGTEIFVRFVSNDDAEQDTGFMARGGMPLTVTACDGNGPQQFTTPNGIFATVNYPVNYGPNSLCEYLFQAPAGQRVEVGFNNVDIEECCGCDFIAAYDGNNVLAPKASHWFGTGKASQIRSSGNELYFRFTSDVTVSGSGFFGYYRFV